MVTNNNERTNGERSPENKLNNVALEYKTTCSSKYDTLARYIRSTTLTRCTWHLVRETWPLETMWCILAADRLAENCEQICARIYLVLLLYPLCRTRYADGHRNRLRHHKKTLKKTRKIAVFRRFKFRRKKKSCKLQATGAHTAASTEGAVGR